MTTTPTTDRLAEVLDWTTKHCPNAMYVPVPRELFAAIQSQQAEIERKDAALTVLRDLTIKESDEPDTLHLGDAGELRSAIFDVLRRHDVSEQCFAEVAMLTFSRPASDGAVERVARALSEAGCAASWDNALDGARAAIAAVAEVKGEPIAWRYERDGDVWVQIEREPSYDIFTEDPTETPLFAHPAPSQPTQPEWSRFKYGASTQIVRKRPDAPAFPGFVIGWYQRLDGSRGYVMQHDPDRIVHVNPEGAVEARQPKENGGGKTATSPAAENLTGRGD